MTIAPDKIELIPVKGFPLIREGDDLASPIAREGLAPRDIVVIAQKVVSKSEGRLVILADVTPSQEAYALAARTEKDPRLVQLVLDESASVLRERPGLLITRHRLGYIMANAGIDASNTGQKDAVLLLPRDPDRSAQAIATTLKDKTGHEVGVIITDSWGRPWRQGTVGFAIGVAGLAPVRDMCGVADLDGRLLVATAIGVADELAAAASLLMGQAAEATPAVIIRGFDWPPGEGSAVDLLRPSEEDLFR